MNKTTTATKTTTAKKAVARKKVTAPAVQEVTTVQEVTAPATEVKENKTFTMSDVDAMYQELGIKYGHKGDRLPKGNYRIMKGGSSLNLTKKGIAIYSTESDAKVVEEAHIDGVTVANDNTSDTTRPWSVKFTDFTLVRQVLALYVPSNS